MDDSDWPEIVEAHRGPKGGEMFMRPGHPGHVFHRYTRMDLVNDVLREAHDALRGNASDRERSNARAGIESILTDIK